MFAYIIIMYVRICLTNSKQITTVLFLSFSVEATNLTNCSLHTTSTFEPFLPVATEAQHKTGNSWAQITHSKHLMEVRFFCLKMRTYYSCMSELIKSDHFTYITYGSNIRAHVCTGVILLPTSIAVQAVFKRKPAYRIQVEVIKFWFQPQSFISHRIGNTLT